VAEFAYLIRKHWTKYLPAKVKALRASGELEESIQGAAKLAQAEVEHLMKAGYQEHEAKEVALHQFVYLKPEPGAGQPARERRELAAKEREYRRNPPVLLDEDYEAIEEETRQEILWELRSQLLALSVLARDGTALIGLGEAINALDLLSERGRVRVNVEVSIGFRFGGEGMCACVEVNKRGVRLSTMRSGAEAVNYSLDQWDVSRWCDTLHEILSQGGTLRVSRNRG
jgi:hypothetical protein